MTVEIHPNLTNFVRPSEHSDFSPSGGDKWMACPFSINASKPIEETTSKAAAEGTLAHTVVEDYFRHNFDGVPESNALKMCNEEMHEAAQTWYTVVSSWLSCGHLGDILWFGLEKGIPIFPEQSCFGTADAVIIGTKGCAILDFKFGRKRVHATATQLQLYLLGIKRHLINIPEDYAFNAVISQPRIDEVPSHCEYTLADMEEFEPKVWDAIQTALGDPNLKPVEGNHCFWCKAKRTNDPALKCPAIAQKAISVANSNFDSFLADMNAPVESLGAANPKRDAALKKLIALKPLIDEIVKSAMEEFEFRLERGEMIDNVTLIDKLGKRAWILKGEDLKTKLKELYPEKVFEKEIPATTKMMTLTQVEKEVGKKNFDVSLTEKKTTKVISVDHKNIQQVLGDLMNYGNMLQLGGGVSEE